MRRTHRLCARLTRWTSLCVCLALILASLTLITPTSSGSGFMPQSRNGQTDNGKARKVKPVPPALGAPEVQSPNLEDARQRRNQQPKAPSHLESIMRSRRKPLESRHGRMVGDPLPPKKTASTTNFGDGSERVQTTSAERRGNVGAARLRQARATRSLPTGVTGTSFPATLLRLIASTRGLSNRRSFNFIRVAALRSDIRAGVASELGASRWT